MPPLKIKKLIRLASLLELSIRILELSLLDGSSCSSSSLTRQWYSSSLTRQWSNWVRVFSSQSQIACEYQSHLYPIRTINIIPSPNRIKKVCQHLNSRVAFISPFPHQELQMSILQELWPWLDLDSTIASFLSILYIQERIHNGGSYPQWSLDPLGNIIKETIIF